MDRIGIGSTGRTWGYFNRPKDPIKPEVVFPSNAPLIKKLSQVKENSVKITIEDLKKFGILWIDHCTYSIKGWDISDLSTNDLTKLKEDHEKAILSKANLLLLDILNRQEPKTKPNIEPKKFYYVKIQSDSAYKLMATEENTSPYYLFLRDINTRISYSISRVAEIRGPVTISENIEELPKLWG